MIFLPMFHYNSTMSFLSQFITINYYINYQLQQFSLLYLVLQKPHVLNFYDQSNEESKLYGVATLYNTQLIIMHLIIAEVGLHK